MATIPLIDVDLDKDNIDNVIREVCTVIRPNWHMDEIQAQVMTSGYVSLVVKCQHNEPQNSDDAFIIKTTNQFFCGPIQQAKKIAKFVSEKGLGPKIFAFIRNGICMEVLTGNICNDLSKLTNDTVSEAVADELAKWHSRSILQEAFENGLKEVNWLWNEGINNYDNDLIPEELRGKIPSKEEILHEEKQLKNEVFAKFKFEQALCHGDVGITNIAILEREKECVKFFDFDFTGIMYVELELAHYFYYSYNTIEDLTDGKVGPGEDTFVNEEYEMKFLKHYLRKREQYDAGFPDGITDSSDVRVRVRKLYERVQVAKIFIYLKLALTGPLSDQGAGVSLFMNTAVKAWAVFPEVKRQIMHKFH